MVLSNGILLSKANQLLALALQQWESDEENKKYEPHFHIKIYKKLSREEYFDMRRSQAMELLAKEFSEEKCKLFKIDNTKDDVKSSNKTLAEKIRIKPQSAKKTTYLKTRYKPKCDVTVKDFDGKHEPYNVEIKTNNIYDVLKNEIVDFEFPNDDISVTTQIVDDSKIEFNIESDMNEYSYKWNAYKQFWHGKKKGSLKEGDLEIHKMDDEELSMRTLELKDLTYQKFLNECSSSILKPIKLGANPILTDKGVTFNNNSRIASSLVTLPNCILDRENKKRLAYITDGYHVSDVKYIYEFEYDSLNMIYADSVNLAFQNGFTQIIGKIGFDIYDKYLNN